MSIIDFLVLEMYSAAPRGFSRPPRPPKAALAGWGLNVLIGLRYIMRLLELGREKCMCVYICVVCYGIIPYYVLYVRCVDGFVMELPRIMYYTFVVWTVWEKVFFRMVMEVFISFSRFAFTYRKEKESLPYFPQSISHRQIIYHKSFFHFITDLPTCLASSYIYPHPISLS